jgi:hypothetical protein
MRCISCNDLLSDYETTRKYRSTGVFLDLCSGCSSYVSEIEIEARRDLKWLIDDVQCQEDV